jgi:hypothetical protein
MILALRFLGRLYMELLVADAVQRRWDECTCDCHWDGFVVHSFPCCEECPWCGKNVAHWSVDVHEKECTARDRGLRKWSRLNQNSNDAD